MKRTVSLASLSIFCFFAAAAWGQMPQSPAEQKMAAARRAVAANPERYEAYNQLALAQTRRARETADGSFYDAAQQSLEESFRLAPANLEAERIQIWVLLGRHEFAEALERATALNKRIPDDVMVYGFLVDANVELGNYDAAETAAQWMLDLRPGNVPALTRAAYLRELFGDVEGAIELMQTAYQRLPPQEVEDRAWTLTQLAHLHLAAGKVESAEALVESALKLFPDYHYALANLAKVRTLQGRDQDAANLWERHYEVAAHPENLYVYAQSLQRIGKELEAKRAYEEFEKQALEESGNWDNANRELIFYYTDVANEPEEAVKIARLEIGRRKDAHTHHAYAWALRAKGDHAEAWEQMRAALAVGIQDPTFLYHAGVIALENGDAVAAKTYFERSITVAPVSEVAAAVRSELGRLGRR
jgi:tetratricopeptide (TPR) repeat protein